MNARPPGVPDLLLGQQLGGYRVDSLIGAGGMSRVYRGYQMSLQRPVAIKVLAPGLAADTSYRDRFLHESRLAASIEHPNILPIYDAGESGGYLYLAMRLVDGIDLRRLLEREGALVPARALSFLTQAGLALDAAHARGLIHRDVKPANLLLEGEHLFLTDFGVAKVAGDQSGLTRIGMFVGTIDYASPEQIRQEQLDGRSDLYSLACVFYQCLTGIAPFDRPTDHAMAQAHLTEPPPPLRERRPELPAALDAVLATALAKDRDSRYRSGRFFADAARWALEGRSESVPTRPTVIASIAHPQVAAEPSPPPASHRAPSAPQSSTPSSHRKFAPMAALGVALAVVAGLLYSRFALSDSSQATVANGSLESAPTPTPTATRTQTPTPAPTHPYAVALRPEQVIMPPSEFPLNGYSVSTDEAWGFGGWMRQFDSSGGDYYYIQVTVFVYSASTTGSSRVAAASCDFTFTNPPPPVASEVTADVYGDAAKACNYHWVGNIADWEEYIVATRNTMIIVAGEPRRTYITNTQAMNQMIAIARQQIAIIDRVAPR